MDVAVDQAGQDGGSAQIDHPRAGHIDEANAYFGDGSAADDHAGVAARRLAGFRDQGAGVDHGDRLGGRLGASHLSCGRRSDGKRECDGK